MAPSQFLLSVWPKGGGDVYLDILLLGEKPVGCLLLDGCNARAQLMSYEETIERNEGF